jgi:alkanesulfonate monooxygenase SsuD/methylene tetrahydromethanopterin reductase-like flavin-dependent oxidoreductase (luciferase family)
MVTGNGYRNPALQAKMASTLDVLSHGRFRFGIGAGNYEDEYRDYGYEFPDGAQRVHELHEALQIILSMWTNTETTFQGDFYQVRHALNDPKGVQKPHVPLLIGGGGEKGTLRLVAEYGDACNVVASPSELARKYGLLKEHCAHVGRDYNSITRTSMSYCIIDDSDEEARAAIRKSQLRKGSCRRYKRLTCPLRTVVVMARSPVRCSGSVRLGRSRW